LGACMDGLCVQEGSTAVRRFEGEIPTTEVTERPQERTVIVPSARSVTSVVG
jgi:hypothetical protein